MAAQLIALFEDEDPALKVHALRKLNGMVDTCWSDLAAVVSDIERLSEPDEGFPEPALAASVASKCFFHLEAYDQALLLAYSAGEYFDINARTEYVETLIDKCLGAYVALRTVDDEGEKVAEDEAIDERMVRIVELMFERCYADGAFTQAIGLALEARRLDTLEASIRRGGAANNGEMLRLLRYTYDVCHTFVTSRDYRCEIMRILARLYHGLEQPEYSTVCQCLLYLDEPKEVAAILKSLIASAHDDDDALMAYQVAFDLCESENQRFLLGVYHELARLARGGSAADGESESKLAAEGDAAAAAVAPLEPVLAGRLEKLRGILLGSTFADLSLKFLQENNQHKRDNFLMLKRLKTATEKGNNTLHHAVVVTHAMFNCGTGNHEFLRENIDWMFKAKNWAQFSAVASLGVIHRGKTAQSRDIMRTYLPGAEVQPYPNGGALYALGLIHANRGLSERAEEGAVAGQDILSYLTAQLESSESPVVQAGACLGLGLAGMTAGTDAMYDKMTEVMYQDDAVGGEAAAVAIGLLFAGRGGADASAAKAVAEGLTQAHDTKHEKIIRGIGMSMGLISFGQEEAADPLIDQLSLDQDPILRYGGMFTIGLAYTCVARSTRAARAQHARSTRAARALSPLRQTPELTRLFALFPHNAPHAPRTAERATTAS